jgi:hypothetical protein
MLNTASRWLRRAGFPTRPSDLITVAQALHWFDLSRFFVEAKRVLKPSGLLAVWTYATNEFDIAEILKVPAGTVKSRIARGIGQLREIIGVAETWPTSLSISD